MLVEPKPIAVEGLADFDEAIEIGRLHKERVGAELVCEVDVAHVIGAGEDDDAQTSVFGLVTNPFKEIVAAHTGQAEVEEDEGWEGELGSIGVFARATEIGHGIVCGAEKVDTVYELGLCEGSAKKGCVFIVVLDYEEGGARLHRLPR